MARVMPAPWPTFARRASDRAIGSIENARKPAARTQTMMWRVTSAMPRIAATSRTTPSTTAVSSAS